MIQVTVERSSVCMGDDCLAPHARTYTLDDNATYVDLFESVKKDNYFPSVSGNNVVWVLTDNSKDCFTCIFSYFTKTDKFSGRLSEKYLKNICNDSKKLMFKYYSSPQRWKESICRMFGNDECTLRKEEWMDEIKYCDLLMKL